MPTQQDPVAGAAGLSEEQASARPGFARFISQEGDYEGARAFGFWFSGNGESERYAMVFRRGMSPLEFASALEKIAAQMRQRTGTNGTNRLAGNEVNASDFTRLPNPESERPIMDGTGFPE